MRIIPLTQGQFTRVDDADYEWLSLSKWCAAYCKKTKKYTAMKRHKNKGKWSTIRMSRAITEAPQHMQVDHKNRDTLDNQRRNLRVCTQVQNECNKSKPKIKTTSRYKGVHWNSQIEKWKASISVKNRCHYLGTHNSEIDAARAYDVAAIKNYGEFANINGV